MCLAIPGEILSVTEGGLAGQSAAAGESVAAGQSAAASQPADGAELRMGRVSFGGLVKDVCLACVPEAKVGDFVLVHAGFAIAVVSAEHAREVTAYLERIGEAAPDAVSGGPSAGPEGSR